MMCTEMVIQDHAILRRGLDILDGMVRKLESGERIEIMDGTNLLKFLRVFGDEYHQTMEENVLYPALLRASPEQALLRQMLSEHGEERALVAAVDDALKSRRGVDFVRGARRLSLLLRSHLDKEDAILRQIALSNDEDNVVVVEFAKNHKQPETYVHFSRLEWKYAQKSQTSLERWA
jgi:hemerythrin-like domain-containing protein